MASKNFRGILRDPLGDYSSNDKYRFTHVSTTGEVIRGSTSYLNVAHNGVYNIDIEYGNVFIESYSELGKRWITQGTTTINADTTATTLPALLNALVPATPDLILQLEALLANAEQASSYAQAAAAQFTKATSAQATQGSDDTAYMTSKKVKESVEHRTYLKGEADIRFFNRSNVVGFVSQSEGVPVGAIIERGSNANGQYVKFADGTLICTGTQQRFGSTTPDGGIYAGGITQLVMSTGFAAKEDVHMSGSIDVLNMNNPVWLCFSVINGITFEMRVLSGKSLTDTGTLKYTAIGKWV